MKKSVVGSLVGVVGLSLALVGCSSNEPSSSDNGASNDEAVAAPKATFNPDPVEQPSGTATAEGVMNSLFQVTQGGYGIGANCGFDTGTAVNLVVVENTASAPVLIDTGAGSSGLAQQMSISPQPAIAGCGAMGASNRYDE